MLIKQLVNKTTSLESTGSVGHYLFVGEHEIVRVVLPINTHDVHKATIERLDKVTGKLLKKVKINDDFITISAEGNTYLYPGEVAVNPQWVH